MYVIQMDIREQLNTDSPDDTRRYVNKCHDIDQPYWTFHVKGMHFAVGYGNENHLWGNMDSI